MNNSRFSAVKALLLVNDNIGYSNIVINNVLKDSDLSVKDKALCTTIFYGVLERKITIDYIILLFSKIPLKKISANVLEILRVGVYQILFMEKIPDFSATDECVKLAKKLKLYNSSGFINAVLRNVVRNKNMDFFEKVATDTVKYLSIRYSCPENLIRLWTDSYGEKTTLSLLEASLEHPGTSIRVNTLKTTKEVLIEDLKSYNINVMDCFLPNALILDKTGALDSIKAFLDGKFHVEDLSSQLCCEILSPALGDTVVDVCAAPGGKTFTTAEKMQNTGKIFAFDLYQSKVNLIKKTAEKLGISIIEAKENDASSGFPRGLKADRVLCDVPCSGLGIIRKKPEIKYKVGDAVNALPDIQYKILCNAKGIVKEGGTLVYSTCTLNPKENNMIADRFLNEHSDFEALDITAFLNGKKAIDEPKNQLTLMPHIHNTDGFFIAAFKKRSLH